MQLDAEETGGLTSRQFEVAQLVDTGLTNSEIASELGISERTVKTHVTEIRRRLGIPRRRMISFQMRKRGML